MAALIGRAARALLGGWPRRPDPLLDHGHVPYGAWEAELTAYARLRTGTPIKVRFAIAFHTDWADELHLARPIGAEAHDAGEAFRHAELDLEHALMHHRHGWREATLLWHAWAHGDQQLHLPWPPWDQVALPAAVIRKALERAVPDLILPAGHDIASERRRSAAQWVAAAWEDGAHRALELAERPGLAERLPPPSPSAKPIVWHAILEALARHEPPSAPVTSTVRGALDGMLAARVDRPAEQVERVLGLVEALASARLLPPVPELRPAWLRPSWGRWQRSGQLLASLEELVRSPESAQMATITSEVRAVKQRSLLGPGGGGGAAGRTARPGQPGGTSLAEEPSVHAQAPLSPAELEPEGDWGLRRGRQLPSPSPTGGGEPATESAEGSGDEGGHGLGGGAGTLGALHVVTPSPEDRAAYWQLRGALAPEIESLIERFRASGDAYYASAPRRFQRHGRLDRGRLVSALKGREAVFSRFVHVPAPEHALCLILDCSASMHGHAEQLREMAILTEAAASAVGARVTAFSFGASWERMEPAAKGSPLLALGRELHPRGGTPFGPALGVASAWLAQQPYDQKRLWVFTDGRWSARDRAETGFRPEHLEHAIVWVLAEQAPEPPHPAMRLVAAPTLGALVEEAPRYFWEAALRAR